MAFPTWIIIAIVLLLIVVFLIKSSNSFYVLQMIKEKFFYIFLFLIFIFVAISLVKIHSKYDLDLTSKEGVKEAAKIYLSWLANVFKNIGKITGYAVQQDWFSANETNKTKEKK